MGRPQDTSDSGTATPDTTDFVPFAGAHVLPYLTGMDSSNSNNSSHQIIPTRPITPPSDAQSKHEPTATNRSNGSRPAVTRRRGHCKSRLGCFNCKRRRVKCNELRPLCSPCRRLGLKCEYPVTEQQSTSSSNNGTDGNPRALVHMSTSSSPSASPAPSVGSPLTLDDLRFYHQFLTIAFPSIPLEGEVVWKQFGSMTSNYEHLAHALLGLGASHISQNCGVDYRNQALQHRVTAIKLVNEQLDDLPTKTADADALLATILCLVAQSSLMPDSMLEYLTMTRGANLVASRIPDQQNSLFTQMSLQRHIHVLRTMVREQEKDLPLIDGFVASVANLQSLCHTSYETAYAEGLLKACVALRTSSKNAWEEFVGLYLMPVHFSNADFNSFVDPNNHLGRILIIHMFLFDYAAGRFAFDPADMPKMKGRRNVIVAWTRGIAANLPAEWRDYMHFPLQFCDLLQKHDSRSLHSP